MTRALPISTSIVDSLIEDVLSFEERKSEVEIILGSIIGRAISKSTKEKQCRSLAENSKTRKVSVSEKRCQQKVSIKQFQMFDKRFKSSINQVEIHSKWNCRYYSKRKCFNETCRFKNIEANNRNDNLKDRQIINQNLAQILNKIALLTIQVN